MAIQLVWWLQEGPPRESTFHFDPSDNFLVMVRDHLVVGLGLGLVMVRDHLVVCVRVGVSDGA